MLSMARTPTKIPNDSFFRPRLSPRNLSIMTAMSPLLTGGKSLTQTVRTIMTEPKTEDQRMKRSWSEPSSSLVTTSQRLVDREKNAIQMESQLTQLKYLLHLTQTTRHSQLERIVEENKKNVDTLKVKISTQEKTIGKMKDNLLSLSLERCELDQRAERMRKTLEKQSNMFNHTLQETHRAMQQHAAIMVKQDRLIRRLQDSKEKDTLLETGFVLLSVYLLNTPAAVFFVKVLATYVRGRRQRQLLAKFWKLLLALQMVLLLQHYSNRMRLSQRFWARIYSYFRTVSKHQWRWLNFFKLNDICRSVAGRRGPARSKIT